MSAADSPVIVCPYTREELLQCAALLKASARCKLCDRLPHQHEPHRPPQPDPAVPGPAVAQQLQVPAVHDPRAFLRSDPLTWDAVAWATALADVRPLPSDLFRTSRLKDDLAAKGGARSGAHESIASRLTHTDPLFLPETVAGLIGVYRSLRSTLIPALGDPSPDARTSVGDALNASVRSALLLAARPFWDNLVTELQAKHASDPISFIQRTSSGQLVERAPVSYYFGTVADVAISNERQRRLDLAPSVMEQLLLPVSLTESPSVPVDVAALSLRAGLLHTLAVTSEMQEYAIPLASLKASIHAWYEKFHSSQVLGPLNRSLALSIKKRPLTADAETEEILASALGPAAPPAKVQRSSKKAGKTFKECSVCKVKFEKPNRFAFCRNCWKDKAK